MRDIEEFRNARKLKESGAVFDTPQLGSDIEVSPGASQRGPLHIRNTKITLSRRCGQRLRWRPS